MHLLKAVIHERRQGVDERRRPGSDGTAVAGRPEAGAGHPNMIANYLPLAV